MNSLPISDYTHFDYKTEYWIKVNRNYENRCEQDIVRRLLDKIGPVSSLVDIGGGFGRLSPLYLARAQHPFLVDFALHQLQDAQNTHGPSLNCVAANFYFLPFQNTSVDVALTVRTLHHVVDLPAFIAEISRIIKPGGYFIFEIPNQRHWVQILRYWLRLDRRNPFSHSPIIRGKTFYNYHPDYVRQLLSHHGFIISTVISTSYFRSRWLKRILPTSLLFKLDRVAQTLFSNLQLTPSIFGLAMKQS